MCSTLPPWILYRREKLFTFVQRCCSQRPPSPQRFPQWSMIALPFVIRTSTDCSTLARVLREQFLHVCKVTCIIMYVCIYINIMCALLYIYVCVCVFEKSCNIRAFICFFLPGIKSTKGICFRVRLFWCSWCARYRWNQHFLKNAFLKCSDDYPTPPLPGSGLPSSCFFFSDPCIGHQAV